MTIIIYRVTNIVDGKIYIGQTRQGIAARRRTHERTALSNGYLYRFHRALKEHGLENFQWETIDTCADTEEANEMEYHYIKQYQSTNEDYGYNICEGRSGEYLCTTAIKELLSIQKRGNKNPMSKLENRLKVGRFKTEEEKHQWSQYMKKLYQLGIIKAPSNKLNPEQAARRSRNISKALKGRTITEEWRRKISQTLKAQPGRPHTPQTIDKIRRSRQLQEDQRREIKMNTNLNRLAPNHQPE